MQCACVNVCVCFFWCVCVSVCVFIDFDRVDVPAL